MLDIKFIRNHPDQVRNAIQVKRIHLDLDDLLAADTALLELRKKLQTLEEEKNANAKRVPKASQEERPALIEKGRMTSEQIEKLKPELQTAEEKLRQFMALVPNIPSPKAPIEEYTHLAFSIDQPNFQILTTKLIQAGVKTWKENSSPGDSFYFLDPDGHKLEIHVSDWNTRIKVAKQEQWEGMQFFV